MGDKEAGTQPRQSHDMPFGIICTFLGFLHNTVVRDRPATVPSAAIFMHVGKMYLLTLEERSLQARGVVLSASRSSNQVAKPVVERPGPGEQQETNTTGFTAGLSANDGLLESLTGSTHEAHAVPVRSSSSLSLRECLTESIASQPTPNRKRAHRRNPPKPPGFIKRPGSTVSSFGSASAPRSSTFTAALSASDGLLESLTGSTHEAHAVPVRSSSHSSLSLRECLTESIASQPTSNRKRAHRSSPPKPPGFIERPGSTVSSFGSVSTPRSSTFGCLGNWLKKQ